MGGNAFNSVLPNASFPRMSPESYQQLKADTAARLRNFYKTVGTPREAPGKRDHGDIDFTVCDPIGCPSPETIRVALDARHMIPLEGNRTSHFAIPLARDSGDDSCDSLQEFLQVDVRVCGTPAEWRRVMFHNSDGDLGMILGVLTHTHGLAFGSSGLRLNGPLPTAPPCTFYLSDDMDQILRFMGLSLATWEEGFASIQDIFAWVASSSLWDPDRMVRAANAQTSNKTQKLRDNRKMYHEFFEYAATAHARPANYVDKRWKDAAIDHFGKRALYTVILHIAQAKQHAKDVFGGGLVAQWTGLQGLPIREVKDEVKRRLGGEEAVTIVSGIYLSSLSSDGIDPVHLRLRAWEDSLAGKTVDDVQPMVVQAREELELEGRLYQRGRKRAVLGDH